MSESSDEELILGVISPLRFMQVASMLPFATVFFATLEGDFRWLSISCGVAGTFLFGILLGKGLWARRKIPWQVFVLFLVQTGLTVFVLLELPNLR